MLGKSAWIRDEISDLRSLLLCCIAVPAAWLLFLGWDGTSLLAGNDSYSFVLQYRDMLRDGGDWQRRMYLLPVYGGAASGNALPPLLVYSAWAWLQIPPVLAYNLSHFAIQILLAFLGLRASGFLAATWTTRRAAGPGGDVSSQPLLAELAMIVLLAFAPALGWRLGWGHQPWLAGLLVWSAGTTLLAAAGSGRRITLTLQGAAFAALAVGLASPGQQLVFYAGLFGAPIALALALPGDTGCRHAAARRLALPAGLLVSAVLVALPRLWPMLHYATGGDAARSLEDEAVIYSYLTATGRDWLASLTWARELVDSGRRSFELHETDYALGPLLLFLLLVPWRRCVRLAAGCITSLALVLVVATNLSPVSDLLVALIPALGSFRVPARSMILLASFLPVLGLAALRFRATASGPRRDGTEDSGSGLARRAALPGAAAVLAGALVLVLGGGLRESVAWSVALALVLFMRRPDRAGALRWGSVALVVLAAASLAGFRERLLPFVPGDAIVALPEDIGAEIVSREPRLADPLTRAVFQVHLEGFQDDTGWAVGVSALDGYWSPPRRFVELEAALRHAEFRATRDRFIFRRRHPGFPVLRQLYNVCCAVTPAAGSIAVSDLGPTLGPAWFSAGIAPVPDIATVAAELSGSRDVAAELRRTTRVVASPGAPLPQVGDGCADSRVLEVRGEPLGRVLARVRYRSAGDCLLTVSLNHLSNLRARIPGPGGAPRELPLLPANGSLVGVVLPPGEGVLTLEAPAPTPAWVAALTPAGLALFAASCGWTLRQRRRELG